MTILRIVLDNREQALIDSFRIKCTSEKYPYLSWEITTLPLGDIEIYHNTDLLYVCERKTLKDLLASIPDGRYKEQSHRLEHICGASKVIYLIEGIMAQLREVDRKLVLSSLTTLSLKKQFHVWRSVHVQDSADTILAICTKVAKEIKSNNWIQRQCCPSMDHESITTSIPATTTTIQVASDEPSYSGFVRKVKKENITPQNIGEIFLCQIPDVSVASAKTLMNHVKGNFSHLLHIIQTEPESLSSLKLEGPKPRKISKKIIEQLDTYLGKSSPNIFVEEQNTQDGTINLNCP